MKKATKIRGKRKAAPAKHSRAVIDMDALSGEVKPPPPPIVSSPWVYPRDREVTWSDLRDIEDWLSYLRFSAINQGLGSSVDRQEMALARMQYELNAKLDPRYIDAAGKTRFADRGKSAIKAVHRTIGNLGVILRMCGLEVIKLEIGESAAEQKRYLDVVQPIMMDRKWIGSEFRVGKPLFIESIDRLVREGESLSYPLICAMVNLGGLIIVTPTDIWCRTSIETRGQILMGEIRSARRKAETIMGQANGWREKQRKDLIAFEEARKQDLTALKPVVDPADWLERTGTKKQHNIDYKELDGSANTMRKLHELAHRQYGEREIAVWLNNHIEDYPQFGGWKLLEWSQWRVHNLLRDEAVTGFYTARTPTDEDKRAGKRPRWPKQPIVVQAKIFPETVPQSVFDKTQQILNDRTPLRGSRENGGVNNLFTGHAYCRCGGRLTIRVYKTPRGVETYYQCLNRLQFGEKKCPNTKYYPLYRYEPFILTALTGIVDEMVPQKQKQQVALMRDELRSLQFKIARQTKQSDELALADTELTATTKRQIGVLNQRIAGDEAKAEHLRRQIAATAEPDDRNKAIIAFIRHHMAKALGGDVKARGEIREKLASLAYRLDAHPENDDCLIVSLGNDKQIIKEPPSQYIRMAAKGQQPELPKAGDRRQINGKWMTYSTKGYWSDGKTVVRIKTKGIETKNANKDGWTKRGAERIINGHTYYYHGIGWWSLTPPKPELEHRRRPVFKDRNPEKPGQGYHSKGKRTFKPGPGHGWRKGVKGAWTGKGA